jgi:hypothetical protein
MRYKLTKRDNAVNDIRVMAGDSQRWIVARRPSPQPCLTERSRIFSEVKAIMKNTREPGLNVVPMLAKAAASGDKVHATAATSAAGNVGAGGLIAAGSPDDPRMKEAMRLMQAFLAIEDSAGRAALITLAERLVSYDWASKVQQG